TPFEVIVVGKNLGNVVQSLVAMVLGYLIAALFFGYSLTIQQPLLFAVSVLFTIVGFVCFGLIIAPVFVMNPGVQGWQNAMEFPVYVLCGFLFPIALLPGWTTPISYLLPPYWAAVALHGTSTGGASLQQTAFAWGMLVLFSALDLFLASRLFRLMLYKARADATLGLE
ncbi:MAG TPA: ABC transporter permease, partial [Anaerolineales bacterium]|nr:ABC transporter permease [Anaerolineales bacterium]